jgi:glycosyltransferase involved in cell wall biosynthesis
MKILIVTNSASGGGAERSMNTLANELVSRNFDVTQIFINQSVPDKIDNLAPIIELNRKWQSGLLSTFNGYLSFNKHLRRIKPEVLILNCDLPEMYGAFSFFSGQVIAVEHSDKPWQKRKVLGLLVRLFLLFRKTKWVRVSEFLKIWPFNHVSVLTLENPIAPIKHRLPAQNKSIEQIVFIGRFADQKRPTWVYEIAKLSKKKVLFFGEGELLETILNLMSVENLDFTSHGFIADPWSKIPDNSLLVVPSAWEGDGMVVIEAISCNLPFLISDIPEFRRFDFAQKNYCNSKTDFVSRIKAFETKLFELEVPDSIANKILVSRNPGVVANSWIEFLESVAKAG